MGGWPVYTASAACVAGLLGGVHCAAMCGPIVAACSKAAARRGAPRWRLTLFYNAGRIASYGAAGALGGFFGQAVLSACGAAFAYALMPYVASATLLVIALYVAGVSGVQRALETAKLSTDVSVSAGVLAGFGASAAPTLSGTGTCTSTQSRCSFPPARHALPRACGAHTCRCGTGTPSELVPATASGSTVPGSARIRERACGEPSAR
jgi:hypothetical protein